MRKKKMDKKQIELLLINTGLSQKEARIYLYLLEKGPNKALTIFKDLGMKKGNTYALLEELIGKRLVIKKGTVFLPQTPLNVLSQIEEKTKSLENVLQNFKNLIPQLNSLYKRSSGKPTIRYFEGEEGIKSVFEDIYSPKKDIVFGCVDLEKADEVFPAYIIEKLIPKRIKNKVIVHSFVADSPQARKVAQKDRQQLRKTVLLDKNKYPFPAEIDIYKDKIAMLSFAKGEFIGLMIENHDFAESLKSVFRLAFDKKGGR